MEGHVLSFLVGTIHWCYQLNKKDWIDDLKHRVLYTDRGITTIVKY